MLLELLLLFELCYSAVLRENCKSGCAVACSPYSIAKCNDICIESCKTKTDISKTAEVMLRPISPLRDDFRVTGSDAPKGNPEYLYFTVLSGRVYRIHTYRNDVELFYDMKNAMLYTENGCGLYDIAFHTDFAENKKVYLYYAMPAKTHHVNALVEYTMSGNTLEFVKHIATFAHDRPSSYGFAAVASKRLVSRGEPDIVVTNHGNSGNNQRDRKENSYKSAISFIKADEETKEIWADGVGDPIDCDWSIYKAADVFCLSDRIRGKTKQRSLDVYRRGRTYMSYEQRFKTPMLMNFSTTACPIESVKLVSSRTFGGLRGDVYLQKTSCLRENFGPTEFMLMVRKSSENVWGTYSFKLNTEDGYNPLLMNTTLIGADAYDSLYLSGFSIRFNQFMLFELEPQIKRN